MNNTIRVTEVRFSHAAAADVITGLLAFAQCVLNSRLEIDGLTVRRTANGRLSVSYPERTDSVGRRHPLIRPADDTTRRELERQILDAWHARDGVTP